MIGHGRREGLGHTLADAVSRALEACGAEVRRHDLLADGFDPALRLAVGQRHARRPSLDEDALAHRYCGDVEWASHYVIVHPVWWFAPPAILKGWVDRVLVDGVALHQSDAGPPQPALPGRRLLLVQTFNTRRLVDRTVFGGLAELFWRRAVCLGTGWKCAGRLAVYGADQLRPAQIERQRERAARAAARLVGASPRLLEQP